MADRFWVGGTGTWNNTSTVNWAASTGGAPGASVPTTSDNVIFDNNSATGAFTVTTAFTVDIFNFDSTQLNNKNLSLVVAGLFFVSGTSFLVGDTTTISGGQNQALQFNGVSGVISIRAGVNTHDIKFFFDSACALSSELKTVQLVAARFTDNLQVYSFSTNNYNITCRAFSAPLYAAGSTSNFVNLGTSTITVTGLLYDNTATPSIELCFDATDIGTYTANAATFVIDDSSAVSTTYEIKTRGTIGRLEIKGTLANSTYQITGFLTPRINVLYSQKTSGVTLALGSNYTLMHLRTSGSAGNLTKIQSLTPGTQRSISCISGNNVNILYSNYLRLTDITTTANYFFAGSNSENGGNNGASITFSNAPSVFRFVLPAGSSTWTIPFDWDNNNNTIECVGCGGSGDSTGTFGNGGGGGAYAKTNNAVLPVSTGAVITTTTARAQTSSVGGSSFFGASTLTGASISGTTLTVATGVSGRPLAVGTYLAPNAAVGTKIIGLGTGTGGVGTYILNISQTVGVVSLAYVAQAAPGTNGGTTAGAGGSVALSQGDVVFAGGNSGSITDLAGGGGGAAGPNGAGGDAVNAIGGTGNGGLVAGATTGNGLTGTTQSYWSTLASSLNIGIGSGGAGGDGSSAVGGTGGSRGGGGGGDFVTSGLGGAGFVLVSYTPLYLSSGTGTADTSDMFFMF